MTARSPAPRRRSAFTARLQNSAASGESPHVLDDTRAAILRGDQPPGTAIPIESVAAFFGVSQIPVREALKILLGEGLVEHVPHVGYSVAKLTFEEFRELYEVRRALEAAALVAAMERASSADDVVIAAAAEAMTIARAGQDHRAFSEASRRFHLAMIEPSGMHRLLQMYESAWNLTEPARPMSRVRGDERQELEHDHRVMSDAFLARDAAALVAAADEHYAHLLAAIAPMAQDPVLFRHP